MKLFIKKIFLFTFFSLILSLVWMSIFYVVENKQERIVFVEPHITDIFMGDSHIQCAIHDTILTNAKNFALQTEPYFFTYYKLSLLLSNNPHIKNVYLGFGYHNLSTVFDRHVYGEFSIIISPKYFFILPKKEQLKILFSYFHFFDYINDLIYVNKKDYIGSFHNDFTQNMANENAINNRIKSLFYENEKIEEYSVFQLEYFEKIINLCKEKNVNIYLIDTPIHKVYYDNVPKVFKDKHAEILKKYSLPFIDLKHIELPQNGYFNDGDHVSLIGAELTTRYLNMHHFTSK